MHILALIIIKFINIGAPIIGATTVDFFYEIETITTCTTYVTDYGCVQSKPNATITDLSMVNI